MSTDLHLGDESKLRMPNPFERLNLQAWQQAQSGLAIQAPVMREEYREVPLESVVGHSPMQVRAAFDPDTDSEDRALVESISSEGQRVPVLLAESDAAGSQQLMPLDGHRRIAALRHIGHPTVKAVIVRVGTLDCDLISLTANVRKNLAPMELARALNRLETQHELRPDDVAQRVGLTRSYVWDLRRLIKAPAAIVAAVEGRRIAANTAMVLLSAAEEHQPQLLALAETCELSEAATHRLVNEITKHELTPEQAAAKLNLVSAPTTAATRQTPESPSTDPSAPPTPRTRQITAEGLSTREEIVAHVRELFPEVTEEQAGGVAELAVDHSQPRKVVKAACLLVLSNWDPVKAVEGAELSTHDPQVRRVVAMLDLCLELETMFRNGEYSRECAPMLVGLMRRLLATKRLALKLEKE